MRDRIFYIRCSLQTKTADPWYMYYGIFTSESYYTAVGIYPIFWQDFYHGWCIYTLETAIKRMAPITYSKLVELEEDEPLHEVFQSLVEEELNYIKKYFPEYRGSFYIDGTIDNDKFILPY
jgi:hypothetical protein